MTRSTPARFHDTFQEVLVDTTAKLQLPAKEDCRLRSVDWLGMSHSLLLTITPYRRHRSVTDVVAALGLVDMTPPL